MSIFSLSIRLSDMKAEEWLAGAAEAHRSRMLALANTILKNREDAEDVVQEAFLRAWRYRETFNGVRAVRPWLLSITRNAAIDFLNRRHEVEGEDLDRVCAPDNPPERHVVLREEARFLARAVRRLPTAHRTAFVLHDVHGYSSREISAEVHLPYHTVRTHLFRARRQLRDALGKAS